MKINSIIAQNDMHLSQKQNNLHIFLYTNVTHNTQIDSKIFNVGVNVFTLFGMNTNAQIISDSTLNLSLQFEVQTAALVCFSCDVQIERSELVFIASGQQLSGVLIESYNSISLLQTFIQFRFKSGNASGVVNIIQQAMLKFTVDECKLSGTNLQSSDNNGFISANVLTNIVVNILNQFRVCIDETKKFGQQSALAVVDGDIVVDCDLCGNLRVVYGLCEDVLLHAVQVNGMFRCVHPFEYVDNQCVCASGYLLNETECVNVVQTLSATKMQVRDIKLESQNNMEVIANNISSLEQALKYNINAIYDNIVANSSNLETSVINNYTSLSNSLQTSMHNLQTAVNDQDALLLAKIAQNSTNLEQFILQNYSKSDSNLYANTTALENRILSNVSALLSTLFVNSSNLEAYIISNYSKSDANLQYNTSVLDQRIHNNISQTLAALSVNSTDLQNYILQSINSIESDIIVNMNNISINVQSNLNIVSNNVLQSVSAADNTLQQLNLSIQQQSSDLNNLQQWLSCTKQCGHQMVNGVCTLVYCYISGQHVVNNSCQCINQFEIVIGNKCTCPDYSTAINGTCTCNVITGLIMKQNKCVCQTLNAFIQNGACTCGANSLNVSNACSCPSGAVYVNDVCVCSSINAFISGSSCVCPIYSILIGNVCTCPQYSYIVNKVCTCSISGQYMSSGACQCQTSGALVISGSCACPSYAINSSNTCICPQYSSNAGDTCQCNSGFIMKFYGQCECQTPFSVIQNGVCVCAANRVNISNTCSCPSGTILVNGECVCQTSGAIMVNSVCQCPTNAQNISNTCSCPVFTVLHGNTCECTNTNSAFTGGMCVCNKDSALQNCSCPANYVIFNSKCMSCPTGSNSTSVNSSMCIANHEVCGSDYVNYQQSISCAAGTGTGSINCVCETGPWYKIGNPGSQKYFSCYKNGVKTDMPLFRSEKVFYTYKQWNFDNTVTCGA
ncbi:Conserved_hypothetical protein [Hexamita inflata]|uniref:EGF-like domain-containing protein n=1 Tax=Hexamita inflata TaxID=28002 RepID=A0AA86QCE2_9EUKA|nr:Conserved hypothetical protein [Hexamita inflata]